MEKQQIKENSEEVIRATARGLIEYLLEHPNTPKNKLTPIKSRICKKYGFINVIKNSVVSSYATSEEQEVLELILRRRLTRTLSGVTIVAVMTKPYECPGNCIFCPGPDSQPGKKVAQSYTGREPAAMRSAMYDYDSYQQTLHRLIDLQAIGHHVDKIELIIMGGTFLYFPEDYQNDFIKGCYDAILNFREKDYNNHKRTSNLEIAKKQLETAKTKLIGLTFETRPDYSKEEHIDRLLELGVTRIEIGIQSTRDDLLSLSNRLHTVQDNIHAIQVAKDAGLKVNAHIMPNLPGSSPQIDLEVFRELFTNKDFRPDMLKIYPTLVVEGTELYNQYKSGKYKPYSQEEIVNLIAQVKTEIPRYVRIQRIQRDIPANLIVAGVKNSNLRQIIQRKLKSEDKHCNCIRCREEGFYAQQRGESQQDVDLSGVKFQRFDYKASGGKEIFLSYEDPKKNFLIGFLRLRIPSKFAHREEIKNKQTAIVREIRVVGEIVKLQTAPKGRQIQHRGYGKALIKNAEDISKELGCKKLIIISGLGVRPYFYNLGYEIDGPYVSKLL
ncbi:MAG: tRNA uridine(34) 5-carboxymethylaminomethyl modification radical SAM/GNAT enzyme Elp3 [Promethearchaeota archaeon]